MPNIYQIVLFVILIFLFFLFLREIIKPPKYKWNIGYIVFWGWVFGYSLLKSANGNMSVGSLITEDFTRDSDLIWLGGFITTVLITFVITKIIVEPIREGIKYLKGLPDNKSPLPIFRNLWVSIGVPFFAGMIIFGAIMDTLYS